MACRSPVERLEPRRLRAADFTVTVPALDSEAVGPALNAIGQFTVRNNGDAGSGTAIQYQLLLTQNSDLSDAVVMQTLTTPALASLEDRLVEFDFPVDASFLGDSYLVAVRFDSNNAFAEASEDDNRAVSIGSYSVLPTLTSDTVTGTSGNDFITASQSNGAMVIRTGANAGFIADLDDRGTITIDLLGGGDTFLAEGGGIVTEPLVVNGGDGNDTITGGSGNDSLVGNAGVDRIRGDEGNDSLSGGGGQDFLDGDAGNDYLLGGAQSDHLDGDVGNDTLSGGGGRDFLTGGAGSDSLLGGAGNDLLFTADTDADTLSGNAGSDFADADDDDVLTSIEELA